MKQFGGNWTKVKIDMLVEYAGAYLAIMNKHPYLRIMYFDGFAGTGIIKKGKPESPDITIGAARRIVEINTPKSFDAYYFVELVPKNLEMLKRNTKDLFPDKQIYLAKDDCNKKIKSMAEYLKKPKSKRDYDNVLAYIDPYGMQLEWQSLEVLKGIKADVWVLVPTGLGVNRLLRKDGQMDETWLNRLEVFLGLSKEEISTYFFREETENTLFGEWQKISKNEQASERAAQLYQNRLREIFTYVSEPMALKNDKNSTMYHLIFMSNNSTALKIANDIINKYSE